MKKIILMVAAVAMATSSLAQNKLQQQSASELQQFTIAESAVDARTFPRLAPAKANDHGIISEEPEGDHRMYIRSGGATYASVYFRSDPQDGILGEVVFSPDGKKAYFKNIISHAATGTWVEGDVEGDKITVPLGQMVYWWDVDGAGQRNYGMMLARVKVNGSVNKYTSVTKGSVTFTIRDNNLYLEDTSGNPDETVYDGLGLVYTAYGSTPAGEWSYYLDYGTVMTLKDVHAIVPPADLVTETFSMEYENSGQVVNIGYDGADIYVQGVSSNLPEAWMKGTAKGNQVTFPLQYAGNLTSYLLYFCGADFAYVTDEQGYGNWVYYWSDGAAHFTVDPMNGALSTTQALCVNNNDSKIDRGEIFRAPVFKPWTEKAATPANPKVSYFADYFSQAGFSIMMIDLPLKDTDGNFIDPRKVSYQIYVDDDEPYTLYPDEYKYIDEAIDEVPYLFDEEIYEKYNRSYIYEKAYAIYIYQSGFERIGVQTIYRGGGEEHRSDICYYDLTETAIADTKATASKAAQHYDLLGRPATPNHRGITISRTADGRVIKQLRP